jgi:hypothetical protein
MYGFEIFAKLLAAVAIGAVIFVLAVIVSQFTDDPPKGW